MYKLLVVEDERWEREGLVALIDQSQLGIEHIYTATDGVQGLARIQQIHPDIIITDIHMPGLTGLEMLENAGDLVQNCVCIILSGYNEFAYAQKALRIGAADFLVKPINDNELSVCLHSAVRTLNRMPSRSPAASCALLAYWTGTLSLQQLISTLNLSDAVGLQVCILTGVSPHCTLPPFSCQHQILTLCLLRPQDTLPSSGFIAAGLARIEADNDLRAAIVRATQAMDNARFHGQYTPVAYCEPSVHMDTVHLVLRMALDQALASLDGERVRNALALVRASMVGQFHISRTHALQLLLQLTQTVALSLEPALACAQTLEAMLDVTRSHLLRHVCVLHQSLTEPERYVLRRVLVLVDEHYQNPDLNLHALASQIFLTPNYVGALFKKSTGIPFNDYLCRHRLLTAQRLLLDHGMRVNAVAQAVGIPNVSYFCVQFRNAYGLTPNALRKQVGTGNTMRVYAKVNAK